MANVKGTSVLQVVRALRANRAAALSKLPPKLHHYLDQRILPSTWYPEKDEVVLFQALASIMQLGTDWTMFGKLAAQHDLSGVYRGLLVPGDAKRTLRNATALWRNFHDTGEYSVHFAAETQALLTMRSYAIRMAEMCRLIAAYSSEVVVMTGVKDVRIEKRECTAAGQSQCTWHLTWR
jgi:hypothetical protein